MSDATPTFTILLPVMRPPDLLPFALDSVLAQGRDDFELFIIGDGAPPETAELARTYAARDPRLHVRMHPKGPGHGEIWRDEALREARGSYVCQIADDDLWLPEHLEEMAALLAEVDFGHCLHVETLRSGELGPNVGNLAIAGTRDALLTQRVNLSGPTSVGYRLAAYRALPQGWSPPTEALWSDLNMWRKFLRQPGLRFGTRFAVTTICLPSPPRQDLSREQRIAENAHYAALVRDPGWRTGYQARVLAIAAGTLAQWLADAIENPTQRQASLAAELADLRVQLDRRQAEVDQLERRLRRAEVDMAFVQRSRLWRWRGRLARLLGRP